MGSQADELARRAREFAARVLRFAQDIPSARRTESVLQQLIDASGSASSNYRAARRARSRAEFVAKLGVVAEAADESEHWLELLQEGGLVTPEPARLELASLLAEARQLRAIFVRAATTARENLARMRQKPPRRFPPRRRSTGRTSDP